MTTGNLSCTTLTVSGAVTTGAVTCSGLITANAGLTLASGQTLTLTGATVAGAPTWSSGQTFPSVTSSGNITSTGVISTSGTNTLKLFGVGVQGDTNYEAGLLYHGGSGLGLFINSTKGGTGVAGPMALQIGGVTKLTIDTSGNTTLAGTLSTGSNSITTTGTVSATTLTGTLSTAAQPNVTSVGNVFTVGGTASTWSTFGSVLHVGSGAIASAGATQTNYFSNAYYNSGYKFKGTGFAANLEVNAGTYTFQSSSASGSADGAITWVPGSLTAGAITSGSVSGVLGSLALKGTTSGTATLTTDATVTKVTLDKPFDTGSNSITGGAGSFTTGTFSSTLVVTGVLTASNTTDATSSTAGGTIISGGAAIAKGAKIGTFLDVGTTLTSTGLHTATGGIVTDKGSTGSIATATPTTIYTMAGNGGTFYFSAFINASGSSDYTASAIVMWEGTGAPRIVAQNGAKLTFTLSTNDVQVTQTAGANRNVVWSYTYQPSI